MADNYFLDMIKTLRQKEEVILYANFFETTLDEQKQVIHFLKAEYLRESKGFPFKAPTFSRDAALWSSQIVYVAAQLILYRKNEQAELESLFPKYQKIIDASSILTADLCLRFIVDMLRQLQFINVEDPLIKILEDILSVWSYSSIGYFDNINQLNFTSIFADPCLMQLYADRIVARKCTPYLANKHFHQQINGNFGLFADQFWPEFKSTTYE